MPTQSFTPPPDVRNPRLMAPEIIARYPRKIRCYAELGVLRGDSVCRVADALEPGGSLHLFDFHDMLQATKHRLTSEGLWDRHTVLLYGNSRKLRDSYNWSLLKVMERCQGPLFDYVFLDGAHTFDVDGFALLLLDRMLKPGGFLELDDYSWYLGRSKTMSPAVFPAMAEWYTEEQINTPHVAKLARLFLDHGRDYEVVQPERLYCKR